MAQEKIKCPKCGAQLELTEVISKEIESSISQKYQAREQQLKEQFQNSEQKIAVQAKKEAEEAVKIELTTIRSQLADKSKKIEDGERKELELIKREQLVQEKERSMSLDMEKKLAIKEKEIRSIFDQEKKIIELKVRKQAEETYAIERQDTQEQLNTLSKKLEESKNQELTLRKKQRELEEKEKYLELEAMQKADAEKDKIAEETKRQIEEQHRLKDAEKDKKLADMTRQIDELKRKAEQGSQQSQGEILELEIEQILKSEFPVDSIESVPKGVTGADAVHVVKNQTGNICGRILWETKRTKAWNESWLQKLKDDQQEAKADIAVLVSETLPKGLTHFQMVNGVWVSSIPSALSLALALRVVLIQVTRERNLQCGKNEKMELVYNYLTGPEFRNRLEAMVNSFIQMKNDLDVEKRAMKRLWDKREKQLQRILYNIGGMHGDLEGLSGVTLPSIKALQLPMESPESDTEEEKNGTLEL